MERRSEERDVGMPNSSINYNNPSQINPEITTLRLPLAPIVSIPSDRRANPAATTRRGSSIFSPTQTLDHHHHHHHHHHHQSSSNLPLPPWQEHKDDCASPDPDPAPSSTAGASNARTPPPRPPTDQLQEPLLAAASSAASPVIRYKECLKNHAATRGGHVVDGCGEFMPSGDNGTVEALRCAACDCHRNFHRREVEGGEPPPPQQAHYYSYATPNSGNNTSTNRNPFFQTQNPPHHQHQKHSSGPVPPAMVNFGGGGVAAESSSDDLNMFHSSGGGHAVNRPSKKRFRTKFSQQQKDRMQELADKLGWRIQKQDEQEVEQFCNETGIKRQVFKVWMHNNKQAMKKRQT